MDLSKLSTADRVIGVSALLFLIALFLPWYGIDPDEFGSYNEQGWDFFLTGIVPLLILVAMVALIAVQRFGATALPSPPIRWGQTYLAAGVAVFLIVLLRAIIVSDRASVNLDRRYGLFIALIAAIGVSVGGLLKSQESEEAIAGPPKTPPTPF